MEYDACKGCGSSTSTPLPNENGDLLYWIAAYKGTKDFEIMLDNLERTIVGSLTPQFPIIERDKFDYYCSTCFVKAAKEQGFEVNDNYDIGKEFRNGG